MTNEMKTRFIIAEALAKAGHTRNHTLYALAYRVYATLKQEGLLAEEAIDETGDVQQGSGGMEDPM